MTFKELYTLDNEKLHTKTEINDLLKKAEQEEKRIPRRTNIIRYGSVAACFVLIGTALIVGLNRRAALKNAASIVSHEMYSEEASTNSADASEMLIESEEKNQALSGMTGQKNEPAGDFAQEPVTETEAAIANYESLQAKNGTVRKEVLLLIPFFLLVSVMVAWAVFRKK